MSDVHETPVEERLRNSLKELCNHLDMRLAMERVYEERDDVEARRSVINAKQLLEASYGRSYQISPASIA